MRKTKSDMAKMGVEMTTLAKEYREKHPGAKWTNAMKAAGVEYRKLHGSSAKKKKKAAKKKGKK